MTICPFGAIFPDYLPLFFRRGLYKSLKSCFFYVEFRFLSKFFPKIGLLRYLGKWSRNIFGDIPPPPLSNQKNHTGEEIFRIDTTVYNIKTDSIQNISMKHGDKFVVCGV